jgi:hypothetical protein
LEQETGVRDEDHWTDEIPAQEEELIMILSMFLQYSITWIFKVFVAPIYVSTILLFWFVNYCAYSYYLCLFNIGRLVHSKHQLQLPDLTISSHHRFWYRPGCWRAPGSEVGHLQRQTPPPMRMTWHRCSWQSRGFSRIH